MSKHERKTREDRDKHAHPTLHQTPQTCNKRNVKKWDLRSCGMREQKLSRKGSLKEGGCIRKLEIYRNRKIDRRTNQRNGKHSNGKKTRRHRTEKRRSFDTLRLLSII